MTDGDATDRCGLKRCTKLDKFFVLIYFCCLFDFFCEVNYANYLMKTKGSVYNVHLDFRGKICEKKVHIIHG